MADPYSRLDPDEFHTGSPPRGPRRTQTQPLYDPHIAPTSPIGMDPRRTPSPGHPLAGYQLDDPYHQPQRSNTGGYGPGAGAHMPQFPPEDRLASQPTVGGRMQR